MSGRSPVELVLGTYQAFSRGEVAAVLASMSGDFEWDSRYPAGVPFGGTWRGHDGVLSLLRILDDTVDVLTFEVQEFVSQHDKVVALGFEDARAKSTGRIYHNVWVHVWNVRTDALSGVRTYNDTAAVAAAFA